MNDSNRHLEKDHHYLYSSPGLNIIKGKQRFWKGAVTTAGKPQGESQGEGLEQ